MALPEDQFKRAVEEYKEIGHEYRYREQLMVQEFSLAMVAIAALLNVLLREPPPSQLGTFVLQLFGVLFLPLLALHLRNINQDRLATLERKDALCSALEFTQVHQNIGGRKRLSAPKYIVRFAICVALAWALWSAWTWIHMLSAQAKAQATAPRAASAVKP
jgi:hypothetical protein